MNSREWQPIETAPKEPVPVDIWRSSLGGHRVTDMFRVELSPTNIFYDPVRAGPCTVRDATHWMPVADRPKA